MNATPTLTERLAAIMALLAVALGAVGAHALKDHLAAVTNGLETWKTAALYHLVHAVVLYFLAMRHRCLAWWTMFAGILLFSGSLYAYSLCQLKFLVYLTPLGGLLLMLAWALLALGRGARP